MIDPCAGAGPATLVPPAQTTGVTAGTMRSGRLNTELLRQAPNPNPGPGAGPMPDVTIWTPAARSPGGGILVIQGRNLASGMVAMIGSQTLTVSSQSSTEIRYVVPLTLRSSGEPLVVYQPGGQVRPLENSYVVFDPVVRVYRVVPSSFSTGDTVTICGTGLTQLSLGNSYYPGTVNIPMDAATTAALTSGSVPQVQSNFFWITEGGKLLDQFEALSPTVSPTGDRFTFVAGGRFGAFCNPNCRLFRYTSSYASAHSSSSGPLVLSAAVMVGPNGEQLGSITPSGTTAHLQQVQAEPVTWQLGPPRIGKAYGIMFGKQEPFVILPTNNSLNGGPSNMGRVWVDGANLDDTTWTIGNLPVPSSVGVVAGTANTERTDGGQRWLRMPINATSAPLCATKNNLRQCTPGPFTVIGGPTFVQVPQPPYHLGVTYTITGVNLLPPSVAGLSYVFLPGGYYTPGDPNAARCNIVFQLLQHTSQSISFRFGDPALPRGDSSCYQGTAFSPGGSSSPMLFLSSAYSGVGGYLTMWNMRFSLTP